MFWVAPQLPLPSFVSLPGLPVFSVALDDFVYPGPRRRMQMLLMLVSRVVLCLPATILICPPQLHRTENNCWSIRGRLVHCSFFLGILLTNIWPICQCLIKLTITAPRSTERDHVRTPEEPDGHHPTGCTQSGGIQEATNTASGGTFAYPCLAVSGCSVSPAVARSESHLWNYCCAC